LNGNSGLNLAPTVEKSVLGLNLQASAPILKRRRMVFA